MREIHDHYFREAKRHGYRSRAAYKLIEIDDRRHILTKGDRVLDVGCAPGSWIQVALERIGDRGSIVGIDLLPITPRFSQPNVHLIEGDFTEVSSRDLLAAAPGNDLPTDHLQKFTVIISDMAPNTTGDPTADHFRSARLCSSILDRLPELLNPGGALVMKCFEGETYPDLIARTRSMFDSCKGFKPKASRSESVEMFIVARGYKDSAGASNDSAEGASTTSPIVGRKPKPRAGWSR